MTQLDKDTKTHKSLNLDHLIRAVGFLMIATGLWWFVSTFMHWSPGLVCATIFGTQVDLTAILFAVAGIRVARLRS